MQKLNTEQIRNAALSRLKKAPEGIRYTQLVDEIHQSAPNTPKNTVHGAVHSLLAKTNHIVRPSRGLWMLKEFANASEAASVINRELATTAVSVDSKQAKFKEGQFYDLFANWLRNDVDEVTETLVLGGSIFRNKWGNPDVIGVYKKKKSDPIDFPLEIVSAEIKIDSAESITAFGQACAYRLFSQNTDIFTRYRQSYRRFLVTA